MIQESIKAFMGREIDERSLIFQTSLDITARNEQIVYSLMQLTGKTRIRIINHVLRSVISFQTTLKYAEYYRKLPSDWVCEEIFLMGFESWIIFERL